MNKKNARGKFILTHTSTHGGTDRFDLSRVNIELEARVLPNGENPMNDRLLAAGCFRSFDEVHEVLNAMLSDRPVSCDIKKVIFNPPATIVLWEDGTKTVVKTQDDDEFVYDPEKGLAMAIAKKALGNKGNYYNAFTKWLPKEDETAEEYEELTDQTPFVPIGHRRSYDKTSLGDIFKKAVRNLLNEED